MKTTPPKAPSSITNSERLAVYSHLVDCQSNSPNEAVMTMAASVGEGISVTRPGTSSMTAITPAAAMSPVSWVFDPTAIATAVLDELALVGKP